MEEYLEMANNALNENNGLKKENAALRAAVAEMAQMMPVLEYIENNMPGFVGSATQSIGISTLNAYRQTLATALAKMNP